MAAGGRRKAARLPEAAAAFRGEVERAGTEEAREALLERVRDEMPYARSLRDSPARAGRALETPAGRLYEGRLLEFIRVPKVSREFGWDLELTHSDAWDDLAAVRSAKFAAALRRWFGGKDHDLAAKAGEYLARLAFDADGPRLARALRSQDWRLCESVARGLQLACEDGRVSEGFCRRVVEPLGALTAGEAGAVETEAADLAVYSAAETLVMLGGDDGVRVLSGPRVLHPRNRGIRGPVCVLTGMLDEWPKRVPPADPRLIWPVYEALRGGTLGLPESRDTPGSKRDQTLGALLRLAADLDPRRTRRECEAVLQGSTGRQKYGLAADARAALRRCRNIPELESLLQAFWKTPGKFRGEARDVLEACATMDHVYRNGLPLCLANVGDNWASAHRGMLVLGEERAAAVFKRAVDLVLAAVEGSRAGALQDAARQVDAKTDRRVDRLGGELAEMYAGTKHAAELYIAGHLSEFRLRGRVPSGRPKGL